MPNKVGDKQTILDSLQSEVSAEASPLLEFITRHARSIVILFILFIITIVGHWFYSRHSRSTSLERQMEIGKILVMPDHKSRLLKLEETLETSSKEMKSQILFAIAESAVLTEDFEKAGKAWMELNKLNKNFDFASKIGQAQAYGVQKKYQEALELYESLLPNVQGLQLDIVNREIINAAELSGNIQRAISACEALLADPMAQASNKSAWMQKIAALRLKL